MYTYHYISHTKRKLQHKCTEKGRNTCLHMVGKKKIAEMLMIHFHASFLTGQQLSSFHRHWMIIGL